MAALMCILEGLLKDDRVASFRFLKGHTLEVWMQQKNFVRKVLQGSPKVWDLATGLIQFDYGCTTSSLQVCQLLNQR